MNSVSMSRPLFLTLILLSLLSSQSHSQKLQVHPFFAVSCIIRSTNCTPFYVRFSGNRCVARTRRLRQPRACVQYACDWCLQYKKRASSFPCKRRNIAHTCLKYTQGYFDRRQTPRPTPAPTRRPAPTSTPTSTPKPSPPPKWKNHFGHCTWQGRNNHIVVDLGKVPLRGVWDRVTRNGMKGIKFVRSPHAIISPRGKYGKMCFKLRAPMTGSYYMSAVSYAPHVTEHNDVWVASSKGFVLRKRYAPPRYAPPGTWLKAYQNNGKKGMSEHFKTIDFNGHRFIIPGVKKGEVFKVCIAGRSKLYEMFRLVFVKCWGKYCQGGIMYGNMLFDLQPSACT